MNDIYQLCILITQITKGAYSIEYILWEMPLVRFHYILINEQILKGQLHLMDRDLMQALTSPETNGLFENDPRMLNDPRFKERIDKRKAWLDKS